MGIFDGAEAEPSAFEIAVQTAYLNGLQKSAKETNKFSDYVDSVMGFGRDAQGNPIELSEQERFDALPPEEQRAFSLVEQQYDRVQKAFAGELPVSERLKQRSTDQFDFLQEAQARRGNTVTGTNLSDAVGYSTPAIQSIGERQRTQGLLEDEERRGEINSGFNNVFSGSGILANLKQTRLSNMVNTPKRYELGNGAGLLSNAGQTSRFNASQQGSAGGILGDLSSTVLGSLLNKYLP